MSAIKKAAEMLRREAESMKECHTVGVGGEWYGDSAKADYDEMIAAADAAIAERDALRAKIEQMERQEPIGWFARLDGDGPLMECKHADLPRVPLYARVGAQAAPEAKLRPAQNNEYAITQE